MNKGQISPETLRQLDESVFRLTEINPETEKLTNIGPEGGLPAPEFPRDSTYTYSHFENLSKVDLEVPGAGTLFELYRSSPDLWFINDNGTRTHWTRRPEEPFLTISDRKGGEDVLGDIRGKRLLGILDIIIDVNESRNY